MGRWGGGDPVFRWGRRQRQGQTFPKMGKHSLWVHSRYFILSYFSLCLLCVFMFIKTENFHNTILILLKCTSETLAWFTLLLRTLWYIRGFALQWIILHYVMYITNSHSGPSTSLKSSKRGINASYSNHSSAHSILYLPSTERCVGKENIIPCFISTVNLGL